jgi:uncharacterized protein YicC (UPF0701 family)
MSVYSMTGYANAQSAVEAGTERAAVNIELRSVNGRFLDLGFRLPDELRSLEPALRELMGSAFKRGKIELRLSTSRDSDNAWPSPTPDQLNRLGRLEGIVLGWLSQARPLSVNEALLWCRGAAVTERLDEAALQAARECVQGLREARAREGARLVEVLMEKLARLRELANAAEPMVPAVVQRQQQRFLERWNEALATTGAAQNISAESIRERALNEAASYAIRIDVAEELARLRAHLDEVERLLRAGGEVGKRLDFLIQELQREANTLGSKSAALELTNVSVEMKVLIEQMREQVQNLE